MEKYSTDLKIKLLMSLRRMGDVIGEDIKIIKTETNDNRSYHVSSQKISRFNWF